MSHPAARPPALDLDKTLVSKLINSVRDILPRNSVLYELRMRDYQFSILQSSMRDMLYDDTEEGAACVGAKVVNAADSKSSIVSHCHLCEPPASASFERGGEVNVRTLDLVFP